MATAIDPLLEIPRLPRLNESPLGPNEDAARVLCVIAALSLVNIGSLDRAADECLGSVDVPQGVTAVKVARFGGAIERLLFYDVEWTPIGWPPISQFPT